MNHTITLDCPQLIVLDQQNYTSYSKKFSDVMRSHYLTGFVRQKYAEYSVRHHVLNKQIQEIYLMHLALQEARINDEYYQLDNKHYEQIFRADIVCKQISLIIGELFYLIYAAQYMMITRQVPEKIEITEAVKLVAGDIMLKCYFQDFTELLAIAEACRIPGGFNPLTPAADFTLTDIEPVFFTTTNKGEIVKYDLRKFLLAYNAFFTKSLSVIKTHSPEALTIGLDNWIEKLSL